MHVEAEDNCAIMAAKELSDYLKNGNITHSVNLPEVHQPRAGGKRICIIHKNEPGMISQITALTTAGLAIDTDCHVLNEEKKAIPGLYAAGDVCGSIEEKDAKQYGMGFDAALTYGYIMGETLKKEI